jgi:glycine C-acetyltransferase
VIRTSLRNRLRNDLVELRSSGLYKSELTLESPQSGEVTLTGGRRVINLCSNNYLGFADDPSVIGAAKAALDEWGFGMASVRFIVGTQDLHRQLENRLSDFLGTEDTILYSSCFDANGGFFEALLGSEDAVISDELNHASIIDGIRLCRARRLRYRNRDMEDLERCLEESIAARQRVIVTDGVFSMDGLVAGLGQICQLAEQHDALVMVDDSHAVGFVGPSGRGTHELHDVMDKVDILTGTLGKALGGASGGYVSGRREIVELLRQRSRPYLFSNSLAPPIVAAGLSVLDRLEADAGPRERLWKNTSLFRKRLAELGFDIPVDEHPIVPVILEDALLAARFAEGLLSRGVYAVAFSYPVVPKDRARIRTQVSTVHTEQELEHAAQAFANVREELLAV